MSIIFILFSVIILIFVVIYLIGAKAGQAQKTILEPKETKEPDDKI